MQVPDNPYFHLGPVRDQKYFYGREEELRQVIGSVKPGGCVSLVGPRRIGKTSLLFRLQALAQDQLSGKEKECVCVYIDGQAHQETSRAEFYSEILDKVCEVLTQKDRRVLPAESPQENMNLPYLGKAIGSFIRRNIKVALLIDEFDVLCENRNFDLSFFRGLRSLATRGVVYVTASKRTLFQLDREKEVLGSPFFNYFEKIELGLFDEKPALRLIHEPSAERGICFDEQTAAEIRRLAGRHPFFLQRVCHIAFEMCRVKGGTLGQQDLEQIRSKSRRALQDQMASYWKGLGPEEEQQVLLKIATNRAVDQHSEVTLENLVSQSLLVKSDGSYELFSTLFRDYVQDQLRPGLLGPAKWSDRFQNWEKLSEGTMSVVYKAYQPALDRYVVIKELKPQPNVSGNYTERFRREAHSIARSGHPNILAVYDFYQEAERAYIVMQYASGGALADRLGEEPFDPLEAVTTVAGIGRALEHAHRKGVIHRDIKPANIFMGDDDWPLLGDFGLALTMGDVLADEVGMTGSPDYVSPEQASDARSVDPRSDIYSLGLVLYHLLVGEVPYAEERNDAVRVVKRITRGVPSFCLKNPRISSEMERIVLKATAPKPDDRYQTAEDMVDDLESALEVCTEEKMTEEYVDFDLHIAPNGHATANSPEGQATADISTQVPNAVRLSLNLIEKRQTNADLLKQVGQELYGWLFPGDIHTHLHQTEARARLEKAKMRLRLRIEAESIASLPLEFLYRMQGGYFLAVNPDTVLSRYLNLPLPPERARRREGPLHMLAIIADPTDQTRLPPDEWEAIIKDALAGPLADGQMTLQMVKRATRKEIRNALLRQKPDIIQFVGHGIYRDGKGYLALVDDQTGKTWLVDDERFANLYLGYDDHLGLISLATCESAKSDDPQGFLGIAPQLVQRGVPAVLSMQYRVLMKTAKIFLEDFYTAVAARKPVDWATQSARNAVSQELGLDNREFATTVLYMRAEDGEIF